MKVSGYTTIPRSRALCPDCEATPAGCRGVRALRGSYCCRPCDDRGGDHDAPGAGARTKSPKSPSGIGQLEREPVSFSAAGGARPPEEGSGSQLGIGRPLPPKAPPPPSGDETGGEAA